MGWKIVCDRGLTKRGSIRIILCCLPPVRVIVRVVLLEAASGAQNGKCEWLGEGSGSRLESEISPRASVSEPEGSEEAATNTG